MLSSSFSALSPLIPSTMIMTHEHDRHVKGVFNSQGNASGSAGEVRGGEREEERERGDVADAFLLRSLSLSLSRCVPLTRPPSCTAQGTRTSISVQACGLVNTAICTARARKERERGSEGSKENVETLLAHLHSYLPTSRAFPKAVSVSLLSQHMNKAESFIAVLITSQCSSRAAACESVLPFKPHRENFVVGR